MKDEVDREKGRERKGGGRWLYRQTRAGKRGKTARQTPIARSRTVMAWARGYHKITGEGVSKQAGKVDVDSQAQVELAVVPVLRPNGFGVATCRTQPTTAVWSRAVAPQPMTMHLCPLYCYIYIYRLVLYLHLPTLHAYSYHLLHVTPEI
jgi:hypothetical protein